MSKQLFSGKLSNGIEIEILEADSFTGKTEFAVKVAGQVASVSEVGVLRTGDIAVKTTAKGLRIKKGSSESSPPSRSSGPTLDDVSA